MANGTGRGTLVFGFILILIGALFLLENWMGIVWFWSTVATWWPLVLIVIGIMKIYRYFVLNPR